MSIKRLPKKVFVSIQGEGDEAYLQANAEIAGAIEDDGPETVGVYVLQETLVVTKEIATKPKR